MSKRFVFKLCLLLALPLMVYADDEPAILGFVKTVSGAAQVIAGDQIKSAEIGSPVYLGNTLKTGEDGSLGVTFKDNTIISFGPDTELVIHQYLFSPATGELELFASLLHGTLHYISGVIAKLKPEAVQLQTPSGVIGVRGTRFVVKTEAE